MGSVNRGLGRGGNRRGAGRPKGAKTVRSRKIAVQLLADKTQKTPLEVMLENMRHFQQAAIDAEAIIAGLTVKETTGQDLNPEQQFQALLAQVKKAAGLRNMAQECARDAASYIHPRLSAVAHTGKDGGPIETKNTNEVELARWVASLLEKAAK